MSLRAAVTPRNDAFGGGTLARAGQPTAASGSFSSPGASGFPNPGVPAILSARNNQGSNVRIPYARIVPLHAKDALPVKDQQLIGTGDKTAYEYDGLESGELAWVAGRQQPVTGLRSDTGVSFAPSQTQMPTSVPGAVVGGNALIRNAMLGQAQLGGLGHGPDRMQRLAYTAWIESNMERRLGNQTIDLKRFSFLGWDFFI